MDRSGHYFTRFLKSPILTGDICVSGYRAQMFSYNSI